MIHWSVSFGSQTSCVSPVRIGTYVAVDDRGMDIKEQVMKVGLNHILGVIAVYARCRKCSRCLKARKAQWICRTIHEVDFWPVSRFVTLTAGGQARGFMEMEWNASGANGCNYDSLNVKDQKMLQKRVFHRYVGQFLKKLRGKIRKLAGLRYFLVIEEHKDGFPHAHLIISEITNSERGLTADIIKAAWWPNGFASVGIIQSAEAAYYVAKYLGKQSAGNRVRGSNSYGEPRRVVDSFLKKMN